MRREIAPQAGIRPTFLGVNTSADLHDMVVERDAHFTPALPDLKAYGLNVYLLKPEQQLAMKLMGMRDKDMADINQLTERLGITDQESLLALWDRFKDKLGESAYQIKKADLKINANTARAAFGWAVRCARKTPAPRPAPARPTARKAKNPVRQQP